MKEDNCNISDEQRQKGFLCRSIHCKKCKAVRDRMREQEEQFAKFKGFEKIKSIKVTSIQFDDTNDGTYYIPYSLVNFIRDNIIEKDMWWHKEDDCFFEDLNELVDCFDDEFEDWKKERLTDGSVADDLELSMFNKNEIDRMARNDERIKVCEEIEKHLLTVENGNSMSMNPIVRRTWDQIKFKRG